MHTQHAHVALCSLLILGALACQDPEATDTQDMSSDVDQVEMGSLPDMHPPIIDWPIDPPDLGPPPLPHTIAQRFERRGPHPAAHTTFTLTDPDRDDRSITVEVWYPASEDARDAASSGSPLSHFAPEGPERDQLAYLINEAPEACVPRHTRAARDASILNTPTRLPTILSSHCHGCTRWSMHTTAEHLASHGFIVIAPDHTGNTLTDALAQQNAPINRDFQLTRAQDLSLALNALLNAHPDAPVQLQDRLDPDRLAIMGHSYGGATAGLLLSTDTRLKAGLAIAVPFSTPLLDPPKIDAITQPTSFLLATEDNSILEFGNRLIRDNFRQATNQSWLAEIPNAGHWSFSSIAGLIPSFAPGCGDGTSQTSPRRPIVYLDNEEARTIAAGWAVATFFATLDADADALIYLERRHRR